MKVVLIGETITGELMAIETGEVISEDMNYHWRNYFMRLTEYVKEFENEEQNLLHRIDELETMLNDERQAKPTSAERLKESAKNPYNSETQPVSHAEWEKAWHKKGKAHKPKEINPFSRRSQWSQWNEWRKAHQGVDV